MEIKNNFIQPEILSETSNGKLIGGFSVPIATSLGYTVPISTNGNCEVLGNNCNGHNCVKGGC